MNIDDIAIQILDLRAVIANLFGMDELPDPEANSMISLDYFRMKNIRSAFSQLREIPEPFKAAVC